MKKSITLLSISLFTVLIWLSMGSLDAVAQTSKKKQTQTTGKIQQWKWFSPWNLAIAPHMAQFPKILSEKTKGQVKLEIYAHGQHPYSTPDLAGAIRDGACQVADFSPLFYGSVEPALSLYDLPFFCSSSGEEVDALWKTVFSEVSKNFSNRYNMMLILGTTSLGQAITADVLVKDFNSLKGKKIRVFNKPTSEMINIMGGTPVTIPPPEIYSAIQKGILNGQLGETAGTVSQKIVELCKYMTRIHYFSNGTMSWMYWLSKDAWNKLPANLQSPVLEAFKEYESYANRTIVERDREAIAKAVDVYGVTVCAISRIFREEIREKMKPVYDAQANFPGGKEHLEKMEKFHSEWMKTHQ